MELIGNSPQIKGLIKLAAKVAVSRDIPVLITGETGTGKGALARLIHSKSSGPFVAVNCTCIPHDLFESELFGYEGGAFTGANKGGRIGRFEEAQGGTIFLDEIGAMSLSTQTKLLTVLDDRSFRRIGGKKLLLVSARIIAATNVNLEKAINSGGFRSDLFYRLSVVSIDIPPLRERVEDIIPMAEHFMRLFNEKYGKRFIEISPEARKVMLGYAWPGNVRELKNAVEKTILMEDGETLLGRHFPVLQAHPEVTTCQNVPEYEESIRRMVEAALNQADGNAHRAARALKIPYHVMRYRMGKYGLGRVKLRKRKTVGIHKSYKQKVWCGFSEDHITMH